MLRLIMTLTGLVLVGLSVGMMLLVPRLEHHAVPMLEQKATAALGVPVTFESLRFMPLLPGVALGEVSVLASDRTKTPLLQCDRMVVRMDPATLFTPRPTVREIVLDGLTLHLDGAGKEETSFANFVSGLKNADVLKALDVQRIRCINGKVSVAGGLLPGKGVIMPLDAFEVDADGGSSTGTVVRAALRKLFSPLLREATPPPGIAALFSTLLGDLEGAGSG